MSRIASDDQMKAPKKAPVVLYTVANRDGDTMPAAFEALAILEKKYQDLDAGLIQIRPGKIPCYCVAPKGYAKVVRL